jgi:hypothetical protein
LRYHLILYGLLAFFGGIAFFRFGDRREVEGIVYTVILLGGLSAIIGLATCDIVDAILTRDDRSKEKTP